MSDSEVTVMTDNDERRAAFEAQALAEWEAERARAKRFTDWVGELRAADPEFAAISTLQPAGSREWQSVAYLLSGLRFVWPVFAEAVMAAESMAPVVEACQAGLPYSSGERVMLEWVAHLWNDINPCPGFPYGLDAEYFERWITACRLRAGQAPPSLAAPALRAVS